MNCHNYLTKHSVMSSSVRKMGTCDLFSSLYPGKFDMKINQPGNEINGVFQDCQHDYPMRVQFFSLHEKNRTVWQARADNTLFTRGGQLWPDWPEPGQDTRYSGNMPLFISKLSYRRSAHHVELNPDKVSAILSRCGLVVIDMMELNGLTYFHSRKRIN